MSERLILHSHGHLVDALPTLTPLYISTLFDFVAHACAFVRACACEGARASARLACMLVYACARMCVYAYGCEGVGVRVHLRACLYAHAYVRTCMGVFVYVCVCVGVWVYVFVSMCVFFLVSLRAPGDPRRGYSDYWQEHQVDRFFGQAMSEEPGGPLRIYV